MRLLAGLAELLAPTRCACCELPGELLCAACERALPRVEPLSACPRCGAPFGALTCTECWSTEFAFEAGLALAELDGSLPRAIVLHKDAGERRLGAVLGALLAECVVVRWGQWPDAVAWIPPTPAALARRGFDHARGIAEPVARRVGAPLAGLLARSNARDQRVLGRTDRSRNAAGSLAVVAPAVPARVLLVDDVLTTGATLDAASQELLAAGAQAVRVAVIARAW